jgi:hypothetical protein
LVLLSYLVVVVLQISWFVREEGWPGGELDAGFALGFGAAVLAFSLLFAIPAWFAMAASQKATQALSANRFMSLVATARWLRRFLIAAGASLLLFAIAAAAALAIYLLG